VTRKYQFASRIRIKKMSSIMENNLGTAHREKVKAHDLDLSYIGKERRLPQARALIPKQLANSKV